MLYNILTILINASEKIPKYVKRIKHHHQTLQLPNCLLLYYCILSLRHEWSFNDKTNEIIINYRMYNNN